MNDYEPIENDDRLAIRLRREARRSRPAFSAALHERVLGAIQAASAPAMAAPPPAATAQSRRNARGHVLSWATTAAASIALTLALVFVVTRSQTTVPDLTALSGQLPVAAAPAASAPHDLPAKKDAEDIDAAAEELANSASGIGDWVRSAAGSREWGGGQWGGLDRDAQRALATVAGPLPFDVTFSLASADGD